jgi:predicted MFS family arabinose efflux permease
MSAAFTPSAADAAMAGDSSRSAARSWLAVGSISVASFATVTTEFLPVGLLTDIAANLHVSDGTAGLMVTLPGIAAAVAAPALIVAAGKLERRTVLIALSALLLVANLVSALAPSFAVMLVGRVLLGVCVGGFWSIAPAFGTQMVSAKSAGRALSIILAGISLGTVAGVPAGSLLGNLFGWRSAFASVAVLAGLVLLAQIAFLPSLPTARALDLRDLVKPLKTHLARIGLIAVVLLFIGHFAAYTYLKPLLEQVFGLPADQVTWMLLVYGAIGIAGTFIGGVLGERNMRVALAGVAGLLSLALLLATVVGTGVVAAAMIVMIWGLAFGAVPVLLTGWMIKAVPEAVEAGQALLVTVLQVALALGALVGGRVVDGWGVSATIVLGGLLAAGAAAVIGVWGRTQKQTQTFATIET